MRIDAQTTNREFNKVGKHRAINSSVINGMMIVLHRMVTSLSNTMEIRKFDHREVWHQQDSYGRFRTRNALVSWSRALTLCLLTLSCVDRTLDRLSEIRR